MEADRASHFNERLDYFFCKIETVFIAEKMFLIIFNAINRFFPSTLFKGEADGLFNQTKMWKKL